ncbi:MAG TPA: AAA family ATPase [Candidatus Kapabacteria bacterium]|nr:AAA family ATPase [Candidatus Kapabacteria bacterium]
MPGIQKKDETLDNGSQPVKLFIAYSYKDETLFEKLKNHLIPLELAGIIDFWYNRKIEDVEDWEQCIAENIETADIFLFLNSSDFLASRYVKGAEVKRALARHNAGEAQIIPVILRKCSWQYTPYSNLQWLPANMEPYTSKKWDSEDDYFYLIVQGLTDVINKKKSKSTTLPNEIQGLPLDLQFFDKLVASNFVYVDKTGFIAKLINSKLTYFFLSRPRRFGKSLLVSTMKEVFLGHKELFRNLNIYDAIEWQTYPVIHFDFSAIGASQKYSLEKALTNEVDKITREFNLPLTNGPSSTKFRYLIENLSKREKKPVVILIDEYDKPIIDHVTNDAKREINRSELQDFFSILKGAGAYLRFLFITGVSRFAQVSIFSALNNLIDLTFDPDYAALTGYTEDELTAHFSPYIHRFAEKKNYHIDDLMVIIKKWYNGYSWDGRTKVYNPFSILRLLSGFEFRDHWFATGTPTFLFKLIKEQKIPIQELDNIRVNKSKLENMEVSRLAFIPLLFQTGYLTVIEKIEMDIENTEFILSYPNRDVRYSFLNYLLGSFTPNSTHIIDTITAAFKENRIDDALKIVKSIFADVPANIFNYKIEASYHALIHVIFMLILDRIGSEIHTNLGRIDHVIETDRYIYIFEFKMNDAHKALKQIHEKKYYEKYLKKGKNILLVGVAFSETERNIKEWITNEL